MNEITTWIEHVWVQAFALLVIGVATYYFGRIGISFFVHRAISVTGKHHLWHQKDIEKRQNTLDGLFKNIWRLVVIVCFGYALLQIFIPDVSTTLAPLFASAGIIGIALGFGAQSLIKDFLSGIFIISENQYRVGDVIELEGSSGTVERIGSRSTVLRDVEGNVHFVPNGIIGHVINKTMGYSMARLVIAVVPETDIDKATAIINRLGNEMAQEDKWQTKIIEAPQYVMIGELTATAVDLIISGKVQPSDQWSVNAELRRRILQEFESEHIKLGIDSSRMTMTPLSRKRSR
jgi:moderate conductance mechanosensitive channel